MSNAGTFAAPWASLSSIFAANKTFSAGDTIFLRSGNHGYALIKGENSGFVVIMPQPGEDPVISRIRVSASASIRASYWKLFRLRVESEADASMVGPSYFLVEVYPYADHITISECTISSNRNTSGWSRDDWRNRCNSGLFTRGRLYAYHVIENNRIENTAFGLTISSSHTVVRGNVVQNFTNDGSRVLGSHILFEKNSIRDLIKVMTTAENHDDLFQAFIYPAGGPGQDTLKNDTIRNNLFIAVTDTTRNFRGAAQGIGCFDGVFLNWLVENNIVITDHWHGISFYGAVNCRVVNNTVIDPYPYTPVNPFDPGSTNIGPTWIRIDRKSTGPPSSGNIVQNNLLSSDVIIVNPSMGLAFNNKKLGALSNFNNYFADVADFSRPANFDLHLTAGSPAIDAGENTGAPLVDFDGVLRPQGNFVDLGAYEFLPVSESWEIELTSPSLKVYPNPFQDRLILTGNTPAGGGSWVLFDAFGRKVLETEIVQFPAIVQATELPSGVYFWNFCTKTSSQATRATGMVIKH